MSLIQEKGNVHIFISGDWPLKNASLKSVCLYSTWSVHITSKCKCKNKALPTHQCASYQQVCLKEIRALFVFFHHVSTGLFNKNKLLGAYLFG